MQHGVITECQPENSAALGRFNALSGAAPSAAGARGSSCSAQNGPRSPISQRRDVSTGDPGGSGGSAAPLGHIQFRISHQPHPIPDLTPAPAEPRSRQHRGHVSHTAGAFTRPGKLLTSRTQRDVTESYGGHDVRDCFMLPFGMS